MTTGKRKPFVRWLFGFVKWVAIPCLALEAATELVYVLAWRS